MTAPLVLVLFGLFGLFGLCFGSFANVVIVRVPSDESLLRPPSKCPICQSAIQGRDNIPVVSWLLLKGRCRSCGTEIPVGYPLVEATTALLWVLAALRFHQVPVAIAYALFFTVLVALSVIDLELQLLPNKITLPSSAASVVILGALAFAYDEPGQLLWAVASGAGYALFLAIVLIGFELVAGKAGMGGGDVKLALLLGMWVGFLNPLLVLYALIAASVVGLAVGLGYLLVRRKSMPYPFGPWLAVGAVLVILLSRPILDALAGG